MPNEKRLTDVTEFKWYDGVEVHKVYLSAILDLCDRRIVSYIIGDRNDNALVYKTFDKAVKEIPMPIHYFIVTADFSIQAECFTTSWKKQV